MQESRESSVEQKEMVRMTKFKYHSHSHSANQCSSTVVQRIKAPLCVVWSVVKKFHDPQRYKPFVKGCELVCGGGGAGSVREVTFVSGVPAERSTERLDCIDDDLHIIAYTVIGGDHKLLNFHSTMTLHQEEEEGEGEDEEEEEDEERMGVGLRHRQRQRQTTVVTESYVVDIPTDSCGEDTRLFADTIIGCNLRSLARIAQSMVLN